VSTLHRKNLEPLYKRRRKKREDENLNNDFSHKINNTSSFSTIDSFTRESGNETSKFKNCLDEETANEQLHPLLVSSLVLISMVSFAEKENVDNDCNDYEHEECVPGESNDNEYQKMNWTTIENITNNISFIKQSMKKDQTVVIDEGEFLFGGESKIYKKRKRKYFYTCLTDVIGWHIDTFTYWYVLPLVNVKWDYSCYLRRLGSFSLFPRTVDVLGLTFRLARSGFYYIGNGRTNDVRCFYCKIEINWNETDDPDKIHKELSPSCPQHHHDEHFLKTHHVSNRPGVAQDNGLPPFRCGDFRCAESSTSDNNGTRVNLPLSTTNVCSESLSLVNWSQKNEGVNSKEPTSDIPLRNAVDMEQFRKKAERNNGTQDQSVTSDVVEDPKQEFQGAVGGIATPTRV